MVRKRDASAVGMPTRLEKANEISRDANGAGAYSQRWEAVGRGVITDLNERTPDAAVRHMQTQGMEVDLMDAFAESLPSEPHLVQQKNPRYAEPVEPSQETRHAPFFGPLPTRGIWTAVGLTRGQFLGILAVSIVLFLFFDGPLWRHTHDSHFWRIMWSYLIILPMAGAALYRNGKARLSTFVAACVVVGLVKLVVTALMLVAIGLGQS